MILAAFLYAAIRPQTPPPSGPLTLDQAVAIAELNAFSIRTAKSNLEKSRQRVAQARGGLGPKVTLGASYTRNQEEIVSSFGDTSFVTQPLSSQSVTANVSLPIDISGNLSRQVRASSANYNASMENLQATANDVRRDTKKQYYSVLRAEGLVRVAEQAKIQAKERADQTELLFKGDQVARVEVARVNALVEQAQSNLINQRNSLALQRQSFNFQLGRPIETPVALAEPTVLPEIPSDPAPLINAATQVRPEVKSLNNSLIALANTRRALEAGNNPSMSLGINLNRNIDPEGFGTQDQSASGTLSLSFPIFDSGITRARVKEARQDEELARISLDQTRLAISQEVQTAIVNLLSAKARYESAVTQVGYQEEVYRLAIVRQQAGESTPLEISDALTELTTSRNGVVSAKYDYFAAYADLERALGANPAQILPVAPEKTK